MTPRSELSDEAIRQLSWASRGLGPGDSATKTSNAGWGLSYFTKYVDVTTRDVLERILWSAVPIYKYRSEGGDDDMMLPLAGHETEFTAPSRSLSYIERFIQSRPDFYGPFWISATLVFAVSIFSNISNFIQYKFQTDHAKLINDRLVVNGTGNLADDYYANDLDDWHYSMDEFNSISSVITMYTAFVPFLIWFAFWFRGCSKYYTLTETACAYGYSLSIYVPLSALLMVQFEPFRYVSLTLASLASGVVLMMSFLPIAKSDPNPACSHIVLAIIPACHLLLGYIVHRIMLQ